MELKKSYNSKENVSIPKAVMWALGRDYVTLKSLAAELKVPYRYTRDIIDNLVSLGIIDIKSNSNKGRKVLPERISDLSGITLTFLINSGYSKSDVENILSSRPSADNVNSATLNPNNAETSTYESEEDALKGPENDMVEHNDSGVYLSEIDLSRDDTGDINATFTINDNGSVNNNDINHNDAAGYAYYLTHDYINNLTASSLLPSGEYELRLIPKIENQEVIMSDTDKIKFTLYKGTMASEMTGDEFIDEAYISKFFEGLRNANYIPRGKYDVVFTPASSLGFDVVNHELDNNSMEVDIMHSIMPVIDKLIKKHVKKELKKQQKKKATKKQKFIPNNKHMDILNISDQIADPSIPIYDIISNMTYDDKKKRKKEKGKKGKKNK